MEQSGPGSDIKTTASLKWTSKARLLMQRLCYSSETLLSNMINRNRIVLSFKDSPIIPFKEPRLQFTIHEIFSQPDTSLCPILYSSEMFQHRRCTNQDLNPRNEIVQQKNKRSCRCDAMATSLVLPSSFIL